jgi:hypothetical protein
VTQLERHKESGLEWQTCKSCRARILFIKNRKSGKTIPVQPVRTLYRLQPQLVGDSELVAAPRDTTSPIVYVSHFSLCPDADRFSSSRKKGDRG